MKPNRLAIIAVAVFAPLALLIATANLSWPVPVQAARYSDRLAAQDSTRRARQTELKRRLSSKASGEFEQAIVELSALDEQGALDLWQAALEHPDLELRKRAWAEFRNLRPGLLRNEFTPQVARVSVSRDELQRMAEAARAELTVWSSANGETTAAITPYFAERLRQAGIDLSVLYDSVADWQQARASGERLALSITPDYQAEDEGRKSQVRIAVIDLARRGQPAAGYSDWLGDRENILMRSDSFIAYLDVFASDGSDQAIAAHIEERYARRGYSLAGFYTLEEFAESVSRYFPGKSFDAGRGSNTSNNAAGEVRTANVEGKFHSYQETLAEFTELARANPHLARLVNLGPTYENRQIFALKISKNPELNDQSKPDVLITGAHHAREWISVEPPVYIANRLIKDYAADDLIRYLVDSLEIWVVPIVNPDGLSYSQLSLNDDQTSIRMWRKNRRPIAAGDCGSDTGVDINRNYEFQWRLPSDEPCPKYTDDNGGSDDPRSELYRGPNPGSELEVKAIKSLLDDPNHRFRAQLDYHNYSQLILYPWGYQIHDAPDAKTLAAVAKRMSDEIFKVARKQYRPQQAVDLYPTTGTSTDYSYSVNRVAAPFVVEMRPDCCGFSVPESEIAVINEENWAGALVTLNWAAGPPVLESVQAYQQSPNGSFSKLVYSARWVAPQGSGEGRQLVVDTRFPGIEPGRLQVRLQFSKPMEPISNLKVTLGRDGRLDELRVTPREEGQGWQKRIYMNDTWVGEALVLRDENSTSQWRLTVSANDTVPFMLDGLPQTVANYLVGTDGWSNYEDEDGSGSIGGADISHLLSPTVKNDFLSLLVGTPRGGERLTAGEAYTVAWTIPQESGFVPVQQEILLSTDGGLNYAPILRNLPGNAERAAITLPSVATTQARIRVLAREGSFGATLLGDSQIDFTIGANVSAAAGVEFLSSERMDQSWSDQLPDGSGRAANGSARLAINLKVTNLSNIPIANPFLRVALLDRDNVLLTRDSLSSPAVGARHSFDVGSDDILAPGESAQVRLVVGLVSKAKFKLEVDLYGVPVGGAINASVPARVWKGKPKSK